MARMGWGVHHRAFIAESPLRHKKSGREENEILFTSLGRLRIQAFLGSFKSSEVKHLKDLFITHTARKFSQHIPYSQQRTVLQPGAESFKDNNHGNVLVSLSPRVKRWFSNITGQKWDKRIKGNVTL